MRNLIYLFIGWFATVNAQTPVGPTTCPWGAIQVGTYSDGTPVCDECTPDVADCNDWFNCPVTHDPRCNLLNCTTYSCKTDEVLVHERFCAKAIPPGQYPICEGFDVFIPDSEMCVNYYLPPADGCVQPDRPYTSEDGTVKCMRIYFPQNRTCPSGYYIHNEGSETVCFTVGPAKCAEVSPERVSASPKPEEPSSTPTVTSRPEEPPSESASASPKPEESTATATTTSRSEEPSSTPTVTSRPEEPPSERASVTSKPEEPTQTAKPNPCYCERPSILVQERYCLWPELIPTNITDPVCNMGDTYITTMGMCKYVIDSSSAIAGSSRVCPDGFEVEQHSDKVVCVRYYEPNSEPCPEEGTVYIKEDNRLGLKVGCYKFTRANCETMTATQTAKPQEKPSETPSITPRVEPSRTPTPTVKPSTTATRTPRRSSTPTMTPKEQVEEPSKSSSPSPKPLPPRDICEQDPRNPRCVKPDSILNQFAIDATIAPLPTFKPAAKPFKPMEVAPTPTPWAIPEDVIIPPEAIPPYMPSRMSFTDGNPTQFEEPQKVQEIQASIACTLRMPLEKIRVENITILTLSTGERQKVAIDPTDFMMESNGTVVCYQITASARLLRALQSTDIQVDIDYLIVKPTTDILALNTSQFAEIIRTSPVIQTFAQSVGSTGVAAEVTVASYAGIQTPIASGISSTSSPFKFPTYGIGILGGVGGLLVLASVGVGYYIYKRKQTKKQFPIQSSTKPTRVQFVDEVDVTGMQTKSPRMLGRQASTRAHFNPLHISTGMADIGQAV
jgi:hypothetical protein